MPRFVQDSVLADLAITASVMDVSAASAAAVSDSGLVGGLASVGDGDGAVGDSASAGIPGTTRSGIPIGMEGTADGVGQVMDTMIRIRHHLRMAPLHIHRHTGPAITAQTQTIPVSTVTTLRRRPTFNRSMIRNLPGSHGKTRILTPATSPSPRQPSSYT